MNDITFANPEMFWLALLLPFLVWWKWSRKNKDATFGVSGMAAFDATKRTFRNGLNTFLYWLPLLLVAVIIII